MVKPKDWKTWKLASSEGANPKTATYTCMSGQTFNGLKAWREHMKARSALRKRTRAPKRTRTCPRA